MTEIKTIKNEFNNIIKYPLRGTLEGVNSQTDNLISLLEVENDINKLRSIRKKLLERFEFDVTSLLNKDKKSNRINFNSKKLMQGDLLDLDIYLNGHEYNCLFTKYGLNSINEFNSEVEEILEKIMPYIRRLYEVYEHEKMHNILANDFYDGIYVNIGQTIKKLLICGDGVIITDETLKNLTLTLDEKIELIEFFYGNLEKILKRIYIRDEECLERFKPLTTEGKVLTLYRGRK